jgi:hypothetical protein
MFKGRNSKAPVLVECVLFLLAIAVITWGLQGKLSLYQGNPRAVAPMNSSAKLTTGEASLRVKAFVERQGSDSAGLAPIHVIAAVVLLHLDADRSRFLRRSEVLPRQCALFSSPDTTLRRRPPPTVS